MKLTKIYGVNGDDYFIHRIVTHIFEAKDVRFVAKKNYIIAISKNAPVHDTVHFAPNTFIEYMGDINLKSIVDDTTTNFTLRCNPVKRINETKRYVPLYDIESITKWLTDKLKNNDHGFTLSKEITIKTKTLYTNKNGEKLKHLEAIISGSLLVTNYDLFEQTIINGIGQSKYLGYGLLNIFDNI